MHQRRRHTSLPLGGDTAANMCRLVALHSESLLNKLLIPYGKTNGVHYTRNSSLCDTNYCQHLRRSVTYVKHVHNTNISVAIELLRRLLQKSEV